MRRKWRTAARVTAVAVATVVAASIVEGVAIPAASAQTAPRRVSAWLPWWDQTRGYASFEANADLYAAVSPFWYEMRSAAEVSPFSGAEDPAVIDGVRSHGVTLIPTITNEFDGTRVSTMLASPASRSQHVEVLAGLAASRGYDGLDIDYENLPASDRDRYSAFVSELATALHASGKTLTVTVHPKTSEPGSWSGPQAHDYAAIGAVADRVRVMAYDYHWASSAPGAIAPVWWVEDVVAFAVGVIPAGKVELGMPLYGYDWVGSTGEGVTFDMAQSRMQSHGAVRQWSSTDAAPWFTYDKGGKTHTVWYEDADSVAAKLPLVDRYGLAGAVLWRLGGEDPGVWDRLRQDWDQTVDEQPPTKPRDVKTKPKRRQVKVSWTAATDEGTGVSSYLVFRSRKKHGTFRQVGSSTNTTHRDVGLKRDTRYWYYLVAVDGADNQSRRSQKVRTRTK